ncbi:hypothetical protein OYT1_ch0162 [Ferriphaselus amnicola]|uniref:Uncharacterized protein n=1 Tax=Ferriphaselus amnicola TaxID=1188319 RepID=A0A2Z6G8F9_9PROT|nr:hypothetical protein OYT1_ch0162 [Ferriphaselus amnicola]
MQCNLLLSFGEKTMGIHKLASQNRNDHRGTIWDIN